MLLALSHDSRFIVVLGNCVMASSVIADIGSNTVSANSIPSELIQMLLMALLTSVVMKLTAAAVPSAICAGHVVVTLITSGPVRLISPNQPLGVSPYIKALWIISSDARLAALARSVVRL